MTKPLATGLEGMHHAMVGHSIEVTRTRESDSWAQAIASGIAISLTSLLDVVLWHYILKHDDHQVARGAWMLTPEHVAYIDDVETEEPYRRRGFAQTLMQRMLSDAAAAGATESILSASPMGRPLYQKLGYAEQAVILVLTKYEQGST